MVMNKIKDPPPNTLLGTFCGTRAVEGLQEVPPVWQIGSQQSTKTQNRNLQLFMLPCTATQSL
jgi:hypothetical protein